MPNRIPVDINLESTEDPQTLRYALTRRLYAGPPCVFGSAAAADGCSPLATALFEISGVETVTIAGNAILLRAAVDSDMRDLNKQAMETIVAVLEADTPLVTAAPESALSFEDQLKQLLDLEIVPALARDGGSCRFVRIEDKVVYLELLGACAGCPGATMTLRMFVESRLKQAFPDEVERVMATNMM